MFAGFAAGFAGFDEMIALAEVDEAFKSSRL